MICLKLDPYRPNWIALCIGLAFLPGFAHAVHTDKRVQDFWPSGGSANINLESGAKEWGTFRGRPVNLQTVYTSRDGDWEAFVSSHAVSGQPGAYHDKNITLIIQTSPFPSNVGANYKELVAGSYDKYWQQIGELLKKRQDQGFAPVILSPAWEMNGTYMSWGGGKGEGKYRSPSQYIQGFHRIVEQARIKCPQLRIAWTINGHGTPAEVGTTNAFDLYPGDEYVDFMGIDDYDHYPPSLTKEAFDRRAAANAGIQWLAEHARQHGKKIILPEWGLAPGSGTNGGGDNANYIQWMFEAFQGWNTEGLLAGEYYFADPIGNGNVDSDLIGSNPLSSKRYVSLWKKSDIH